MTPGPLGHIGRYELLDRLAAGGMGEVFLARAVGTGGFEKRLVIKRILPHLADDPEFIRRFIAEGKLVVRLRHAGIAQVLDMGEEGGVTFIAMEYVDGRDLGELVRLARTGGVEMPAPLIVTVIVRLLEALDYAHTATDDDGEPLGIIHRDISPSNVMISRAGEVKLLDFGIARAAERLQATTTGAIRGKYSYMSPQQAAGAALDARSDLFSVGVLMWELLAGARPFDGDSDLLTLDRIRFFDPGPLIAAAPDVPAPVAAVVDRLLKKDPEDRFPTAEAAMRALMAWLNEVGAVVVPRDLSAWLERVLETVPEGLRRRPSGGMSLDDVLLLGLGSDPGRSGPMTDPVGERAPFTRTVSAPGNILPGLTPGTYTPAPASPSRVTGRPITPVSQPVAAMATPYPTDPETPAVGVARTRGRRGVFALLVGLNLLLLAAVAWLVVRATDEDNGPAPVVDLAAADAVVASDATSVAGETTAHEEDATSLAAAADTVTVEVAEAHVAEAADAGPPVSPGLAFGALVDAVADEYLLPEDVELLIRASPPEARVVVDGYGSGSPRLKVSGRPRSHVRGVVSAGEWYQSKLIDEELGDRGDLWVQLKEIPHGTQLIKFLPADGKLAINGKAVSTDGSGKRELTLKAGDYTATLTNQRGQQKSVGFTVRAGENKPVFIQLPMSPGDP